MEFKLRIVGERPTAGDLILNAETPLDGVKFVEEVGKCLRRSIDHVSRFRHLTLGALSAYEMNLPQQVAIDSGLFESTNAVTVIVEKNMLSHYIFYNASMSYAATRRPCYPYMSNEAVLTSYIDELAFIQDWAECGYATKLAMVNGSMVDASKISSTTSETEEQDTEKCHGCPAHQFPPPPPRPMNPPKPRHHHDAQYRPHTPPPHRELTPAEYWAKYNREHGFDPPPRQRLDPPPPRSYSENGVRVPTQTNGNSNTGMGQIGVPQKPNTIAPGTIAIGDIILPPDSNFPFVT